MKRLLILLLGLAMLGGGGYWLKVTSDWKAGANRATGTVVEVRSKTEYQNGHRKQLYSPTVRFTDTTGREITFSSNVWSSSRSHHKGQEVELLYDPKDAKDARLDSFSESYLIPGVLVAFGGLLTLGGLFGRVS